MFLQSIEWVPTLVAFALSFVLGWLWYSPLMFVKGWMAGIGEPVWRAPMWMPMAAQAFGTLLLSVIVGFAVAAGHVLQALLIGIMLISFIKANGFYSGKTKWAVTVETLYIAAMLLLMIGVHMVL